MNERNDGGPAFPQNDLSEYGIGPKMDGDRHLVSGMSLRDWFAGQALAGMLSDEGEVGYQPKVAAVRAYSMADAMIAAREGRS